MKLETLLFVPPERRGKRGPTRGRRLTSFGAAYVRLQMAQKRMGFHGLAELLGCSVEHAKNVTRGVGGITKDGCRRLCEALVSPFNAPHAPLSPAQLSVYDQMIFAPLLSFGAEAPTAPPTLHVSFDKLVFCAKLAHRERLLRHVSLLDACPETRGPSFFLIGSRGPVKAFWERSKMDNKRKIKPWKRYLPFWRTANLKAFVEGEWCVIAKLSIDPFRKRCEDHRGKRGAHLEMDTPCDCDAHGVRCPADHFEYIPPPYVSCRECDDLTDAQPNIRFEVTGLGCTLGLHTWLGASDFTPFVDRETITVSELHVAVDMAAPAHSLLPFQRKPDGNRGFRKVVPRSNDLDSIGHSWGSSSRGFSASFYDKSRLVFDVQHKMREAVAIMPSHAEGAEPWTRIEFRFRPVKLGFDPTPDGLPWEKLLDRIGTFLAADLRHLQGATPLTDLVWRARQLGFIARTPSATRKAPRKHKEQEKRNDKSKRRRAPKPAINHFGPWVASQIRQAGMSRKAAESAASILHAAVLEELVRLSERSGIDLRGAVESEVPRLRHELAMCVGVQSNFDWSDEHAA